MEVLLGIVGMVLWAAAVIGWLWITVTAFSDGETLWGIGCLIISPLCIVYGLMNMQELKAPLIMLGGSLIGQIALGVLLVLFGG